MCPTLTVDEREQALVGFFGPVAEFARVRGHAYVTDDGMAGALWSPPEVELYDGPGLERLGAFFVDVVGERAELVGAALQALNERHPTDPHFYLAVLGTHPTRQGHGLGQAAVAPVLRDCDETGLGAYLESSSIRNVPFYERLGFEVTGEVALPDGPVMHLMWRDPQPPEK
jgi:GNAT superfamily N-acetyltransferase